MQSFMSIIKLHAGKNYTLTLNKHIYLYLRKLLE